MYKLICSKNLIVDTVGGAVHNICNEALVKPVSESFSNYVDNAVATSSLNAKIENEIVKFGGSVVSSEFSKIMYPSEVESKLLVAIGSMLNTISNEDLNILKKNTQFIKSLGNLSGLFYAYCNQRNPRTYHNDNKFLSILLTGVPGTGKTVFMKIIWYFNNCLSQYTGSSFKSYFLTGSFFLIEKDEAKSMQLFLNNIEKQLDNGEKVIICVDECELMLREKEKAPAVTLLLEFLSRISRTLNEKNGRLIILCSTNTSNNFDSAAFRRFKYTIVFNHVEADPLIINLKSKLKELLINLKCADIYENMSQDPLFNSAISSFFKIASTASFGEIDNIISNFEMYFLRFKNYVTDNYNVILILSLIEYIKKESNLKYPGDKSSLYNSIEQYHYMIEDDLRYNYNIDISLKECINLIFYEQGSLLLGGGDDTIGVKLSEIVKNNLVAKSVELSDDDQESNTSEGDI